MADLSITPRTAMNIIGECPQLFLTPLMENKSSPNSQSYNTQSPVIALPHVLGSFTMTDRIINPYTGEYTLQESTANFFSFAIFQVFYGLHNFLPTWWSCVNSSTSIALLNHGNDIKWVALRNVHLPFKIYAAVLPLK